MQNNSHYTEEFVLSVYDSMFAMSICDGELHEEEQSLLNNFLAHYDLLEKRKKPTSGLVAVDDYSKYATHIRDCLNLCTTDEKKYFLLEHLSEIADADDALHDNEVNILQAIREAWGLEVTFSKQDIEWSEEQRIVIDQAFDSRVVVHAPPGAGKTALITQRIKTLIDEQGIEPSNVWLISFTRTAVRELRDRIVSQSKKYPFGIKIATLDSTAFAMNVSISGDRVENFEGYEDSIENFTELLESADPDLMSFLEDLEHLVIDEAQDLVGARKSLCVELLKSLGDECGVTVLGDRLQQIYGQWSTRPGEDTTSLLECFTNGEIEEFEWIELKKIWRTNSPGLLGLLEDLRTEMLFIDSQDSDDYSIIADQVQSGVKVAARNALTEEAAENYLVLFRATKQVIEAAFQLTVGAGRAFRFRLPRYPRYIAPWVNRLFRFAESNDLEELKEADLERFNDSLLSKHEKYLDKEHLWGYLKHYATSDNGASMRRLRERLGSNSRAPVEFQHPEFGFSGPVLGTVHSSKGREAENVLFRLPEQRRNSTVQGEEARVIFVAASRAKKNLELLENSSALGDWRKCNNRYASLVLDQGRTTPWCLMEVGIEGDYDPFSVVSREVRLDEAEETQNFLRTFRPGRPGISCWAERTVFELRYRVYVTFGDNKYQLGWLGDRLHTAFTDNSRTLFRWKHHPPIRLRNLSIVDTACMVCTRDDPRAEGIHDKYGNRGTWLYPVLFSLGPYQYLKKK